MSERSSNIADVVRRRRMTSSPTAPGGTSRESKPAASAVIGRDDRALLGTLVALGGAVTLMVSFGRASD